MFGFFWQKTNAPETVKPKKEKENSKGVLQAIMCTMISMRCPNTYGNCTCFNRVQISEIRKLYRKPSNRPSPKNRADRQNYIH